MKKILFFLLTGFAATAQILSPIQKSHPQMDDKRLAYIDTVMEEYVQKNWMVGSTTLVIKDNSVVYFK